MLIQKSFKYKLKLTSNQEEVCCQIAGACRFVWNKSLALKKEAWEKNKKNIHRFELDKLLTEWKNELDWLTFPPSQSLQQVNKDLDQAFKNFFRRLREKKEDLGFPRFKKKGCDDSFRIPQGVCLVGKLSKKVGLVKVPKLGKICFTKTREIEGEIKHTTISRLCDCWYISFNCEVEINIPKKENVSMIGIDRGVKIFAMCSNGEEIKGISPFKKNSKKLAQLQKALAKKERFSSNWKKIKAKIKSIHLHIKNVRKDCLHKASSQIAKNHGTIVMEKLQTKNMTKSAKGTIDNPGKNVRAKSGLNRSILDQGWYMFQTFIEYKKLWTGGKVVYINPQYTSKRCNMCGYISKENRKTQELFHCLSCAHKENADLNAAKNILAEGHSVLACGAETLVSAMNQELQRRKPIAV